MEEGPNGTSSTSRPGEPELARATTVRRCLVFGGTGFIGSKLVDRCARSAHFDEVVAVDIRPPAAPLPPRAKFVWHDVRKPLDGELASLQAQWIFNLAAVHREPGHAPAEYFDTNINGARNVCAYAAAADCSRVFFMSTIACYGRLAEPVDEAAPLAPRTAYGVSKQAAELVHETWQRSAPGRRLVVCRAGAVYGPGDPGNIPRLIRAVRRGRFCFAGDPEIRKSCGYVYDLIDSMEFMLDRTEPHVVYNFAEPSTPTLRELVHVIAAAIGAPARLVRLPQPLVVLAAHVAQTLTRGRSPLHPVRVRKSATATCVLPRRLEELGFRFRHDFASALRHWQQVAPEDFT